MPYPLVSGLLVRPIEMSDVSAWSNYVCLPEVKRHTSITASNESDIAREVQMTLGKGPETPVRFVVQEKANGEVLATVGFHSISAVFGTAEIAYDVAPLHWGRGIATQACRAACLWGFQVRGWHRIQATTLPSNAASQRVLERCGFGHEGMMRNLRLVRGQPADFLLFSAIPGDVASVNSHS